MGKATPDVLILSVSQYGNTRRIAYAIARGIPKPLSVRIEQADQFDRSMLTGIKLLIVGSPTQGGRAIATLDGVLMGLPDGSLVGIRVAAFDTRFLESSVSLPLRLLMKIIGYAAPKILHLLKAKGGRIAVPAEGFIVTGKEGPLAAGEEARAASWARRLSATL